MDVFVSSLPFKLKEAELEELFEKYGKVTSVTLIKDKRIGQNKGYGFVVMPEENEAMEAIKALNGFELMGRMIKVSKSEADRNNSSKPKNQPNRGKANPYKIKSANKTQPDIVFPKDEENKKRMKKYSVGLKLAKNFKVGKRKKR